MHSWRHRHKTVVSRSNVVNLKVADGMSGKVLDDDESHSDDKMSELANGSEEDSDRGEVPSGKYFNHLMGFSLRDWKSTGTARDGFDKVMQHPIKQIENRFKKMSLCGRNIETVGWPGDSATKEIKDSVRGIDKDYSEAIRCWGKFKSIMPTLCQVHSDHTEYHIYLTEFKIRGKPDCVLNCTVCTPITENGLLREMVLHDMDRPVADKSTGRVGHFVPAHKTRNKIKWRKTSFEDLKAELPETDSHSYSEENKARTKADKEAGGSKLFKTERVKGTVTCTKCSKVRCIYSKFSLRSGKKHWSQQASSQRGIFQAWAFQERRLCLWRWVHCQTI